MVMVPRPWVWILVRATTALPDRPGPSAERTQGWHANSPMGCLIGLVGRLRILAFMSSSVTSSSSPPGFTSSNGYATFLFNCVGVSVPVHGRSRQIYLAANFNQRYSCWIEWHIIVHFYIVPEYDGLSLQFVDRFAGLVMSSIASLLLVAGVESGGTSCRLVISEDDEETLLIPTPLHDEFVAELSNSKACTRSNKKGN